MPEFITAASPLAFPYQAADLTEAINLIPNQWGRLRELDIFGNKGWRTTVAGVRYRDGAITLVPAAERGGPPATAGGAGRDTKYIEIPHLPRLDVITVDDVQDQVSDDDPTRLRTVDEALVEALEDIRLAHAQTLEYMRMSACKGVLVDGAGVEQVNFFSLFGVTKKTVDFALDDASTDVLGKCAEVRRHYDLMARGESITGVRVLVDSTFMDALMTHPAVERYYVNQVRAAELADSERREFRLGGLVFEEYLATVTLSTGASQAFIAPGYGHAVPLGTRQAFRTYWGPPYRLGGVNQMPAEGEPIYVSPRVMDHDTGIELKSESDPLPICQRPDLLVEVTA